MSVAIDIECQLEEELFHVNYDLRRYAETAKRLKESLHSFLEEADVKHEVRLNPGPGEGWEAFAFGAKRRGCIQGWYARTDNQYRRIRYPRLGAFEVSLRCPRGFAPSNQLPPRLALWSKLELKRWPDPEVLAGRVAQLLVASREYRDVSSLLRQLHAPPPRRPSQQPQAPLQPQRPAARRPVSAPQRRFGDRGLVTLPSGGRPRAYAAPFEEADPTGRSSRRPSWCAGGSAWAAVRSRQALREPSPACDDEEDDSWDRRPVLSVSTGISARSLRKGSALGSARLEGATTPEEEAEEEEAGAAVATASPAQGSRPPSGPRGGAAAAPKAEEEAAAAASPARGGSPAASARGRRGDSPSASGVPPAGSPAADSNSGSSSRGRSRSRGSSRSSSRSRSRSSSSHAGSRRPRKSSRSRSPTYSSVGSSARDSRGSSAGGSRASSRRGGSRSPEPAVA